jgi:hypothetical protein
MGIESVPMNQPQNLATNALLAIGLVVARMDAGSAWAAEVVIRPDLNADWRADPENVQAVLESTAQTLWRHFPGRALKPILVEPKGGPIVLYERGDGGEYQVRLDTGDTYWSQYAFQFAHEFCHILCNYDEDAHRNRWFEEAVCETASLYALRAMASQWKEEPPYPNWREYSAALSKYADERLEKSKLPESQTLAQWLADHEADLYQNATNREMNLVVAAQLLPLFENSPTSWEAVTWLNAAKSTQSQTFAQYLTDWRRESPQRHHAFIRRLGESFGVKVE